ncbi:MAG: hypothetical protein JSS55_15940 [Proteobacteria bacterium]|nr:hypothetical protein [Pseudomonadota bacterium]
MDLTTFLALSEALTGFSEFDLRATGQAEAYRAKTNSKLGEALMGAIEGTWAPLAHRGAAERAAGVGAMMGSAPIGEPLRQIALLWYTGAWYTDARYGYATLSGQAYQKGLMWKAIGAHPMAAEPQGFGAWSLPPPEPSA